MDAAIRGHWGLFYFGHGGNKYIYQEDASCRETLRSKGSARNTPPCEAEGGIQGREAEDYDDKQRQRAREANVPGSWASFGMLNTSASASCCGLLMPPRNCCEGIEEYLSRVC